MKQTQEKNELLTQRKNLYRMLEESQQKIKQLEDQLIFAQKLATMGTMSCLVAHEFNNLLMPIVNYSELALKHSDDEKLVKKTLEKTIKQGLQAGSIIESILGMTRSQSQEFGKVHLLAVVNDSFRCLARDFSKDGIKVRISVPETIYVYAIAGQLQQVVLNLIINARQAMLEKKQGSLSVVATELESGMIEVAVSDTGCGIAQENQSKIFDAFFTTKKNNTSLEKQGTGLGLMICKQIIENHHGTITVESQLGAGTTFKFTLPLATK
ncbi:MAG: HAMP domain-containing histidine kinase [Sedimentisphaerales bacterium]|nr:HAMP domain-containing histidine kinase [Sedimentisphaerales bacterium]